MNFLKKPVSSISNAVEINNLKSKRDELNKEKKELETMCSKYDDQTNLKQNVSKIIESNNEIINSLRTLFTKNNIKYDVEFDEFVNSNSDPDNLMYKKLYDQLIQSNITVEDSVKHLDKNICVSREIYTEKITKIDEQIEKTNTKLKTVRDKQFK
jgi:uncharacterized coiled-coil DUF342 family protein